MMWMCIFTCSFVTSGCLKWVVGAWANMRSARWVVPLTWMGGGGSASSVFPGSLLPTQQWRWVTHHGGCATHSLRRSQWMNCLKQTQNNQAVSADNLHTGFISSRSAELFLWPKRVVSQIRTAEFQVSWGWFRSSIHVTTCCRPPRRVGVPK